jgi:hypothetical protein
MADIILQIEGKIKGMDEGPRMWPLYDLEITHETESGIRRLRHDND